MSACRVWSAKSPRPLWTPRTARHVHIPTLHGATSRLRSTWCKPDLQQTLDATKEKRMTLSQTYRTALNTIAGFLLTAAVFRTAAVAQANSPQGVRNIVIVHGAWADGSSWSKVIPLLQAKGLHVVAVQNPL